MGKVILDDAMRAKLNGLNEQIEFLDESGQTLGHFLPADLYHSILYSNDQCPYSEEELQQSLQEPGGRSLADIWKTLEQS
jgi:hypothetical protein